jgi:hypothetical protein
MKEISLSQGQFAIVDDVDFELVSQWKWYAHRRPCTFYAERTPIVNGVKQKVWMHRLINGTPDNMVTDHIDGNGLNNTRANLRSVDCRGNMLNRARWKKGTASGLRGVYFDKRDGCWFSSITIDGKTKSLGRFKTPIEASYAYQEARAKIVPDGSTRPEVLL